MTNSYLYTQASHPPALRTPACRLRPSLRHGHQGRLVVAGASERANTRISPGRPPVTVAGRPPLPSPASLMPLKNAEFLGSSGFLGVSQGPDLAPSCVDLSFLHLLRRSVAAVRHYSGTLEEVHGRRTVWYLGSNATYIENGPHFLCLGKR